MSNIQSGTFVVTHVVDGELIAVSDPIPHDATWDEIAKVPMNPPKRGRPPGFKGTPNRDIQYCCDVCGDDVGRDNIYAKRVIFAQARRGGSVLKSRTVAWMCLPCLNKDPQFTSEKFVGAPGMRGTSIAAEQQASDPRREG